MSSLGSTLLAEFRALIHATYYDSGNALWPDAKCYTLLTVAMQEVASELPLGEAWSLSDFTVSAGSASGTLSTASSAQYQNILELRRNSDGYLLQKLTREELDHQFWHAQVAATAGRADPICYAMYEDSDQTVTVKFQAPAKANTAIDVLRSIVPIDLTTAGTETVSLARWAMHATAHLAAAMALEKMSDFEVRELRLNRGAAQAMRTSAMRGIRNEEARRNQLDAVGRQMRWVT